MNPSASGWIEKFGFLVKEKKILFNDHQDLYLALRKMGFIYGINVTIPEPLKTQHNLSDDELAKINLFNALYHVYYLVNKKATYQSFLEVLLVFYKALQSDLSFWEKLLTGKKNSSVLEKLIHNRVQLDDNLLTKNFNKTLTNSLLYVDVLTFSKWLSHKIEVRPYAARLEYIIINLTYHSLNSKEEKSVYDEQLVRLFQASMTYTYADETEFDGSYREELQKGFDSYEKQYFLDLACLAVWDDRSLEYKESDFVYGIGKDMRFKERSVTEALDYVTFFYREHKEDISLFKESNLVKNFYDNSSELVNKLISRNRKRLQKELLESKELMGLLAKSTTSELSREERKKMKSQLLDIIKSIPSLAIFALPGGAILLPIFVKLIPNLLPSSFDENRVTNKKEEE